MIRLLLSQATVKHFPAHIGKHTKPSSIDMDKY